MNRPHIISMVGREIAGYHKNLHNGFDQLGINNYFFYERTHPFYKHDKKRGIVEKMITILNDIIVAPQNSFIKKLVLFICLYPFIIVMKAVLFPVFVARYDVFIFSANYSYLGLHLDRWILKRLGKVTIDVALGSDARPPYLNGNYTDDSLGKIRRLAFFKKLRIRQKMSTATYIIDHPTTSQFSTRLYIPLLYVGLPFYLPPVDPPLYIAPKPLILHAPSKPKIKGTDIIREVMQDLQGAYEFDYRELVGMPHSDVVAALQRCSFIINELYSDTLMSGLDTEAAWFGKPSIVGGYNLQMVEDTIQSYDVPPTHRITPTKAAVKEAVIKLLSDDKYRGELGVAAQDFVKTNWNAKSVAEKYLTIIDGKIPDEVMRSPYDDLDIYGCGINKDDRQDLIHRLVQAYGDDVLCIDDKPKLKAALLKS